MGFVMQSLYVSDVCMESTSVYWMPIWRLLEHDFHLHLVNPLFLKQLPGRKSDVRDAEWIATVLVKDLVKDSFVPDGNIQHLRQYGRRINELNRDIVRCEQRVDTILQRCNIRLSNHVSRTKTKAIANWSMLLSRERLLLMPLLNSFTGVQSTVVGNLSCTILLKAAWLKATGIC
jgi:Transposase and inactivated derivatives